MKRAITKETKLVISSIVNECMESSCDNGFNRLKDSIEKIRYFLLVVLSYSLISLLGSLALTALVYLISKSVKTSCEFFIITIPVIIGVGLFGVRHAVSNIVTGIKDIILYILELVILYYRKLEQRPSKDTPYIFEVVMEVFLSIILPMLKSIVEGILLGKIIIFIISKAVKRFDKKVKKDTEAVKKGSKEMLTDEQQGIQEILLKLDKIKKNTEVKFDWYLNLIRVLIAVISVLLGIAGVLAGIIIVCIFEFARAFD